MDSIAVFIVMVGVFLAICVISYGVLEFSVNLGMQRLIRGEPVNWFSSHEVFRRRRLMREMLWPALIAFAASSACNVGTSLLVAEQQTSGHIYGSAGAKWLFAGLVGLMFALLIAIAPPQKSPWDLTQSWEALVDWLHRSDTPATVEGLAVLEARMREIRSQTVDSPKRRDAHDRFPIPTDSVAVLPRPIQGTMTLSSGVTVRPRWRDIWTWSRTHRKYMLVLFVASISEATVLAGTYVAFGNRGWRPLGQFALFEAVLLMGAILLALGIRLDFIWASRVVTEETIFQETAERLLDERRGRVYSQISDLPSSRAAANSGETVLQIGRFRLSRL